MQTAFLFPGVVFVVFFILNFFVWGKGSSGAVPFGTLFALLFLWFGISVPLCFVGSYFGFRKKVSDAGSCRAATHRTELIGSDQSLQP